MVIDHINNLWLGGEMWTLRLVGRGAFPLFCYAAAVAVQKASARDPSRIHKYLSRLLLLALLAEPVSELTRHQGQVNILFTLAGGVAFAAAARHFKDWQIVLCYAASCLSMLLQVPMEFGLAGVMLPSAILLVLEGKERFLPFLVLLLFFVNEGGMVEGIHNAPAGVSDLSIVSSMLIVGFCTTLLPWFTLKQAEALSRDGRLLPRYFLYAFYPAHLLALWALKLLFFK